MPFNNLHNEIVEMIFYIHVYCHLESRCSLLLVCRNWFAIATNFTELWRNISWYDGPECTRSAIKCHSFEALVQSVHRTGSATFDLTLGGSWDQANVEEVALLFASLPENWLSRCRSLRLLSSPGHRHSGTARTTGTIGTLLRECTFNSLELLELGICGGDVSLKEMNEFCTRLECTALHLQTLMIRQGEVAEMVIQHSPILSRTRTLVLGWDMPSMPWSQLTSLEHLNVEQHVSDGDYDFLSLSDIVAPRLTRLNLYGIHNRNHFPKNEIFKELTCLILDNFESEDGGIITCTPCPRLVYLGLHYQAFEALSWIDAPNVRELAIHGGDALSYSPASINSSIVPRLLRLDISHSDEWEKYHLTEPLPNWLQVEELHIRLFSDVRDLFPALSKSISGTLPHQQCYPKLICLTVCYAFPQREAHLSTVQRTDRIEQLVDIMDKRVGAGSPRLEILKFGWHWAGRSLPNLFDPSAEWWPTEWTDCLQYVLC